MYFRGVASQDLVLLYIMECRARGFDIRGCFWRPPLLPREGSSGPTAEEHGNLEAMYAGIPCHGAMYVGIPCHGT